MNFTKDQYEKQLAWFVEQMKAKLDKNLHKGGWCSVSTYALYTMLHKEIEELDSAVKAFFVEQGFGRDTSFEAAHVVEECADIANFAMMLADRTALIYQLPENEELLKEDI